MYLCRKVRTNSIEHLIANCAEALSNGCKTFSLVERHTVDGTPLKEDDYAYYISFEKSIEKEKEIKEKIKLLEPEIETLKSHL